MKKNVMWMVIISGLVIATAWASTTMRDLIITSSTVDSTPIGSTTPSTANFTTLKLNGAAPSGHTLVGNGTSYIDSGTLQDEYNQFTGYSYPNDGADLTGTTSVSFATAMPDTNYTVSCSWFWGSILSANHMTFNYAIQSKTTSGYTVWQITSGSSTEYGANGPTYGISWICHAHHG